MIFGFLLKKKIPVPVDSGDLIELKIVRTIPEKSTEKRLLYAKIFKISKKRNVFVNFVSKDKGDDLIVGDTGTITACKQTELIRFATKFLHRNGDTFIFSPPDTFESVKIPLDYRKQAYKVNIPVEYRALTSLHVQQGILVEFSPDFLAIIANLPVPVTTSLSLEFPLLHREGEIQAKGKVISAERRQNDQKKHLIRVSLDEISKQDYADILWHALIASWEEKGD